jgi:hypothetical protein
VCGWSGLPTTRHVLPARTAGTWRDRCEVAPGASA